MPHSWRRRVAVMRRRTVTWSTGISVRRWASPGVCCAMMPRPRTWCRKACCGYVARVVQLVCAVLAHAEHDVARALFRRGGIGWPPITFGSSQSEQEAHRPLQRRIGAFSQRLGHPHNRPDTCEIGQGDQQRHGLLELAQDPHRIWQRGSRRELLSQLGDQPIEDLLGRRQYWPTNFNSKMVRLKGELQGLDRNFKLFQFQNGAVKRRRCQYRRRRLLYISIPKWCG